MNKKKRARLKSNNIKNILKFKKLLFNILIITIFLIVIGFIWSFIENFNNEKISYTKASELKKLLVINDYEKATGHRIRIEILNGCGVSGLADKYSNLFRENGFDVILSKNARNFGYEKSEVILRSDEKTLAIETAKLIGIPIEEITESFDELLDCDVTIIIGKDYNQLSSFLKAIELSPPY